MNIILFVWAMLSQQKVKIAFRKKYPCPPTAQQTELDALDPSCTTLYQIHTATTETSMMTSSNGHIFRVTGHLCGELQRPVTRSFDVFFICVWINGWTNNREAGDLRRYRAHYEVTVMRSTTPNITPIKTQRIFAHIETWRLVSHCVTPVTSTVIVLWC